MDGHRAWDPRICPSVPTQPPSTQGSSGLHAPHQLPPRAPWDGGTIPAQTREPQWLVCLFSAPFEGSLARQHLAVLFVLPAQLEEQDRPLQHPACSHSSRLPACSPAYAVCSWLPQSLVVPPLQTHIIHPLPLRLKPQPWQRERIRPPHGAPAQRSAGVTRASSCQNRSLLTPVPEKGYCS